jgi:hypothetical protein
MRDPGRRYHRWTIGDVSEGRMAEHQLRGVVFTFKLITLPLWLPVKL